MKVIKIDELEYIKEKGGFLIPDVEYWEIDAKTLDIGSDTSFGVINDIEYTIVFTLSGWDVAGNRWFSATPSMYSVKVTP